MTNALVIIAALFLAFLLTIKIKDEGFHMFIAILFIAISIPFIVSML